MVGFLSFIAYLAGTSTIIGIVVMAYIAFVPPIINNSPRVGHPQNQTTTALAVTSPEHDAVDNRHRRHVKKFTSRKRIVRTHKTRHARKGTNPQYARGRRRRFSGSDAYGYAPEPGGANDYPRFNSDR
jgi:hypothetical protein